MSCIHRRHCSKVITLVRARLPRPLLRSIVLSLLFDAFAPNKRINPHFSSPRPRSAARRRRALSGCNCAARPVEVAPRDRVCGCGRCDRIRIHRYRRLNQYVSPLLLPFRADTLALIYARDRRRAKLLFRECVRRRDGARVTTLRPHSALSLCAASGVRGEGGHGQTAERRRPKY